MVVLAKAHPNKSKEAKWCVVTLRIVHLLHYSVLKDDVHIHNFEIHGGINQVQPLFKMWTLTK